MNSDMIIEKKKYEMQRREREIEAPKARPIICGVMNCVHHDGISRCTAERVEVGPFYAKASSDTVCATFAPKVIM